MQIRMDQSENASLIFEQQLLATRHQDNDLSQVFFTKKYFGNHIPFSWKLFAFSINDACTNNLIILNQYLTLCNIIFIGLQNEACLQQLKKTRKATWYNDSILPTGCKIYIICHSFAISFLDCILANSPYISPLGEAVPSVLGASNNSHCIIQYKSKILTLCSVSTRYESPINVSLPRSWIFPPKWAPSGLHHARCAR